MEVLQRTANRGSISTGYEIANSLKFEADNREYLRWNDIGRVNPDMPRKSELTRFASTCITSEHKYLFWTNFR